MREKDGALAEVIEQIYLPVTSLWKAQGLSWQKVLPILFLSGPNCSTNYHCDPTGVLVVQLFGRKCYHSLKEPEKWCPLEVQEADGEEVMSADLKESDILSFELNPGEAVMEPLACASLGGRIRRNSVHVIYRVLGHITHLRSFCQDGTTLNTIRTKPSFFRKTRFLWEERNTWKSLT